MAGEFGSAPLFGGGGDLLGRNRLKRRKIMGLPACAFVCEEHNSNYFTNISNQTGLNGATSGQDLDYLAAVPFTDKIRILRVFVYGDGGVTFSMHKGNTTEAAVNTGTWWTPTGITFTDFTDFKSGSAEGFFIRVNNLNGGDAIGGALIEYEEESIDE